MWLMLFRASVVVLLAHAGYVYSPFPKEPWLGLLLGLGTAIGLIALEHKMRTVSGPHLVGALVGGVTGLFAARLAWGALAGLDIVGGDFVHVLMVVFLAYVGIVIGLTKGEWLGPAPTIPPFRAP